MANALTMLLCGAILGALYCALSNICGIFKGARAAYIILDGLFCVCGAAILVVFIERIGGELRLYVFAFAALGFCAFHFTIHKLIAKLLKRAYNSTKESKKDESKAD